jgi:ppGpp synthetase/RelA/SpoT-type nucleotidyltranferase
MSMPSNRAIDRLGERLRAGAHADGDDELLAEFRASFADASQSVEAAIRGLGYSVGVRSSKSRTSIVAKLRRQTINLTQIQDIAGCRIIVNDLVEQDLAVSRIRGVLDVRDVKDRREAPSHGYRAVHLIAVAGGRRVEIQVRTRVQDRWAQFAEKLSERRGMDLKYGAGDPHLLELLRQGSERAYFFDQALKRLGPSGRIHPSSSVDGGLLLITRYTEIEPGPDHADAAAMTGSVDVLVHLLDDWFVRTLAAQELSGGSA